MSVGPSKGQEKLDKALSFAEWKAQEAQRDEIPRFAKFIVTYTGKIFRPLDPVAADIDIIDIAHALGNICRYTGHVRKFYSVAQHSVLVSENVPADLALQGLLHDASEAYLSDLNSPVKSVLGEYKTYERQLERTILRKYCGVPAADPAIKVADRRALVTESRDLMPKHELFTEPVAFRVPPFEDEVRPWSPTQARNLFLKRFCELKGMSRSEFLQMLGAYI